MGKFKEMDLLRQEREAFDADYPLPPPPHWGDLWVAWNSEDGFTFWEDEQQAIRWSAADSNEYPVRYVMQKERAAPVQEEIERAKQIWREDQQRIAELSAEIDRLAAAQPSVPSTFPDFSPIFGGITKGSERG